ncbi:MAG: endolytic transglycosylase MltG [Clostridia bacterium]|nr:endolytic transglycosylase MltG [Clostridia bacterium]
MKKCFGFAALILALLGLLCACGSQPLEETPAPSATETTTEADPVVRVMFPEGYTAVEIAEKLEKNGVCAAADFMAAVKNADGVKNSYAFLSDVDFSERAFALEGYVFPDTYDFYRGESAQKALSRFLNNMNTKLTEERKARAAELGYTMDEILTLASVIQEECGDPKEMANVSAVMHNRLESPDYGMLQCDVTIHYVNDRITDSPYLSGDTSVFAARYNTYKVRGLPVGAICCPGTDAIDAALYPAESNNFFFVTDADMNYYYAETYAEHLENCKKCGIDV